MMLYDRDYTVLTEREKADWDKLESWFSKKREKWIVSARDLQTYYREIPRAALQNELKKHPTIEIEVHPTKKNTNVYRRK